MEQDAKCGVYAIVVTYFPMSDVIDNLAALCVEVERLIVVDNGSGAGELDALRGASRALGFQLIENGANLGIARALNEGVALAVDAAWVLLFDQDSRITAGFVQAMRSCAEASGPEAKAGIFVPRYLDLRFQHVLPPVPAPDGTLAVVMTSGSMMRPSLFAKTGPFVDWFIYEIDFEFSLRLRRLGYTLHECDSATLLHSPASPQPFRIFGYRLFYTRNYKPATRYYMQRNGQWLERLYGEDFPEYFRAKRRANWKEYLVVLLGEGEKRAKLSAMLRGYRDGRRVPIPTA